MGHMTLTSANLKNANVTVKIRLLEKVDPT